MFILEDTIVTKINKILDCLSFKELNKNIDEFFKKYSITHCCSVFLKKPHQSSVGNPHFKLFPCKVFKKKLLAFPYLLIIPLHGKNTLFELTSTLNLQNFFM